MKAYSKKHNLSGNLTVPGSKSHTIRAVLIAMMAEGKSYIKNPLPSEDCLSSTTAARAYGANVEVSDGLWVVDGLGKNLKVPDDVVDSGNSGTTLYFIAGIASTLDGTSVITGDRQIRRRPIRQLLGAINQLGGNAFTTRKDVDAAPAVVTGPIKPGKVVLDGHLSQYVSAVLLSAPLVDGAVEIELTDPKEKPYLQMTVDWMTEQGIELEYDSENYSYFKVVGPQSYKSVNSTIPSDWEGVAFPLVAALVTDSKLTIEDLDLSGGQGDAVIVDVLQEMGGQIEVQKDKNSLIATGGKKLKGIEIDCSDIPDAVPALSVAGCFAEGETKLTGLEIVRLKETDRVAVMTEELRKMGADIEEGKDYMIIRGGKPLKGVEVDSHGDHRVAMSLTVAGLFAEGETVVTEAESVAVSFPNYFEIMNKVGAEFRLEK